MGFDMMTLCKRNSKSCSSADTRNRAFQFVACHRGLGLRHRFARMTTPFKQQFTLEKRTEVSSKIKAKYPDRVPVRPPTLRLQCRHTCRVPLIYFHLLLFFFLFFYFSRLAIPTLRMRSSFQEDVCTDLCACSFSRSLWSELPNRRRR